VPTLISHGVVALALGKIFARDPMALKFWFLSVFCALIPDADVIGFSYGIRSRDLFGHRGFSHSLFFAFVLGLLVVLLFYRNTERMSRLWCALVCYFSLVTASHGLLDALTDGGPGVGFLAPFDNRRFLFPWRPIPASPLGIESFLGPRGRAVLSSEILWLWIPAAALTSIVVLFRREEHR
jgi:inner membrane protein